MWHETDVDPEQHAGHEGAAIDAVVADGQRLPCSAEDHELVRDEPRVAVAATIDRTVAFRPRFAAVMIGFAANNLLPARVGEFARALTLARITPVGIAASFATLVVERILDGLALVLLTARLVQRSSPQFVLNALFGIGIGAFFAWRSARGGGDANDQALAYFLPGVLYNVVYALGSYPAGLLADGEFRHWGITHQLYDPMRPEEALGLEDRRHGGVLDIASTRIGHHVLHPAMCNGT